MCPPILQTHSILGNDSDPGFIPRCIDDVFNYVESKKETTDFTIMVSYLEVYNEDINDLLQVGEEGKNLRIKTDDPQKGAIIDGLVEQVVSNKKEIQNVLKLGGEMCRRAGVKRQQKQMQHMLEKSDGIKPFAKRQQYILPKAIIISNYRQTSLHSACRTLLNHTTHHYN